MRFHQGRLHDASEDNVRGLPDLRRQEALGGFRTAQPALTNGLVQVNMQNLFFTILIEKQI